MVNMFGGTIINTRNKSQMLITHEKGISHIKKLIDPDM